jgi:hypothetical protein
MNGIRTHPTSGWTHLLLLLLLLLLALLSASPAATAAAGPSPETWRGLSLVEALQRLQGGGLRVVFSSRVVLPGMRVVAEPVAREPLPLLREILEPHGLGLRQGAGDTLTVVPGATVARHPAGGGLVGTAVSRHNGAPLRGVRVRLEGRGETTTTGLEGGFRFPHLPPGRYTVTADAPGFLPDTLEGVEVAEGNPRAVTLLLQPTPVTLDEIVVTPSQLTLLLEAPQAPVALSRQDILTLPHLGDDVFRALSLLPGVTANDVTAQFHIRGGRRDEVQILLDGQELYDAYHLKDFDSALSIVDQGALGEVALRTGGFPVEFGDRMGGVLDMRTVEVHDRRHQLGINLLALHGGSAGTFQDRRGSWLVLARRGSADLVGEILQEDNPAYWDLLARVEHPLGTHHRLRSHLLLSADRWRLEESTEDGSKDFDTAYDRFYLWLTHEAVVGRRALAVTALSHSAIDRDRQADESEEEQTFSLRDRRDLEVLGLRHHWDLQSSPTTSWKGGATFRRFDAAFAYFRAVEFDTPLAEIRDGEDTVALRERFRSEHTSAYIAHRRRASSRWTAEAGLRLDRHTLTGETLWSPRLNLARTVGERGVLRAAWGIFHQSQRPYELPVEDGDFQFRRAERSEQMLLGYEGGFGAAMPGAGRPRWIARVEVYRRKIDRPRPRFENLYEAFNQFPEIEPDRVGVTPIQSEAEGVEFFLRGALHRRVELWLNATVAATEDEVEDGGEFRRGIDQPVAFNATVRTRLGPWDLSLAWRYRTGWPTTPLRLETREEDAGDPERVPVLGALYTDRLPDHHRLDLRLSRRWPVRTGTLLFFLDIQNLYDRANVAGFDQGVEEDLGEIVTEVESWPGIFPSLGVRWEF